MASRDKDSQGDHDSVAAMADRLGLKGKERERYVHQHMRGLGYRMVPSYVADDDEEEERSFFGTGRKRTSQRSRRSGDDDDDDYFG